MNKLLLEEIIKHIYSGFGIIPAVHIDYNRTKSIIDKQFILPTRITFDGDEELNKRTGQVWGVKLMPANQEMKILVANCSQHKDFLEYAMFIQLKGTPSYGLYLVQSLHTAPTEPTEPLLAATLDGDKWLECNTFLQASFLAGMEQTKEVGFSWSKLSSYNDEFKKLKSFIEYHQLTYQPSDEDTYEGQEG